METAAVLNSAGHLVHVPISKLTVQVHPKDLCKEADGRISWRSSDGTRSGMSGLLSPSDPRSIKARKVYHGLVKEEVAELWRRNPDQLTLERPLLAQKVGGRRVARPMSKTHSTDRSYGCHGWRGLMVDNGANTDVVGLAQLRAFESHTGLAMPFRRQSAKISNAGGSSIVVGKAVGRFPLHPGGSFEEVSFKVLDGDAPMLIGKPLMSAMGWKLCELSNTITTSSGHLLPVQQWNGHLFIYWPSASRDSAPRDVADTSVFATESPEPDPTSSEADPDSPAFIRPRPRPPPEPDESKKEKLFTAKELRQIHSRSGHPHWKRMENFLKRVRPDRCPPDVRKQLQGIVDACKACAIYGAPPRRVHVALPHEDGKFNEEVIVDVFSLNKRAVLSIIDRDTRFLSCIFLDHLNAAAIWDGILRAWSLRYLGHPKVIRTDEGSNFVAGEVQVWAGEAGVVLHAVGVERASSMGLGEQIHHPLRRSFLKLKSENPNVSDELLLDVAVKAHNDSSGLNGLVPTLLVFGAFPRLPVRTGAEELPSNTARARMRQTAMAEFNKAIDEMRLAATEKCQAPSAPDALFPGDPVLVWYKKTKKWEGPFPLISSVPHGFYVKSAQKKSSQLHGRECVRPYVSGVLIDNLLPPASAVAAGPTFFDNAPAPSAPQPEPPPNPIYDSEEFLPTDWDVDDSGVQYDDLNFADGLRDCYCAEEVFSASQAPSTNKPSTEIRACANSERLNHAVPPALEDSHEQDMAALVSRPWPRDSSELRDLEAAVLATEVLSSNDPRRTQEDFCSAIAAENDGLDKQHVFERVRVPADRRAGMNILRSRYVLAYKNAKTPEQYAKARLVVQAMRKLDWDYQSLFTYAPTVAKASSRLLLTLAASLDLPLATRDVSQAFVCTTHPLLREVYVTPPKEARAHPDELWRLCRPLYGLPEAGAMWYSTFARYHRNNLRMHHTATDPAVFVRHDEHGRLDGMSVVQVDDTLIMGSPSFMDDEERESAAFPSKGRTSVEAKPVAFNGTTIRRRGKTVIVDQHEYTGNLDSDFSRTPEGFATARGKASYATASTRPDQACAINQASQVRAQLVQKCDHDLLASAITALKKPRELIFPALDLKTSEIRVYADASWANNRDLSSQLGFIVFLVDGSGKCALINWQSKKSRRVTRSTMAAEIFAMCSGFDSGFAFKDLVEEILGQDVPLVLFTDSKTAWDTVTSLNSTTEKRLLIDLFGLREAYRTGEMSNICCIDTSVNPSDSMTKISPSNYLLSVMKSNRLNHAITQQVAFGQVERRVRFR